LMTLGKIRKRQKRGRANLVQRKNVAGENRGISEGLLEKKGCRVGGEEERALKKDKHVLDLKGPGVGGGEKRGGVGILGREKKDSSCAGAYRRWQGK